MSKKALLLAPLAVAAVSSVFIVDNASAIDDPITFSVTNYFTTIQYNGTYKNNVTGETKNYNVTTEEFSGNFNSSETTSRVIELDTAFQDWADEQGGYSSFSSPLGEVTDYYFNAHDETGNVTAENKAEICAHAQESQSCDVGSVFVKTVLDKHQIYTQNTTITNNEIHKVELNLELPEIGSKVTLNEAQDIICTDNIEDCFIPDTIPSFSGNNAHVSILNDFGAWIKDDYEAEDDYLDYRFFEGTFLENGEYYAFVPIAADTFEFDADLKVLINGQEAQEVIFINDDNRLAIVVAKIKLTKDTNPDTSDGISSIFAILGTATLAGTAFASNKAKRR